MYMSSFLFLLLYKRWHSELYRHIYIPKVYFRQYSLTLPNIMECVSRPMQQAAGQGRAETEGEVGGCRCNA